MANIPISSFTAAANATGIGMSGFSLTGSNAQSMLDLAGTWNTSGTPTGLKLNITDTASNAASLLMDLQVGGVSQFRVTKGGVLEAGRFGVVGQSGMQYNPATGQLSLSRPADGGSVITINAPSNIISAGSFSFAGNTILVSEGANILAQRVGTAAQTLRVYETFTDTSNYSRMFARVSGSIAEIGTEAAGTGTARPLYFSVAGATAWFMSTSRNLLAGVDNTYDIGASSANRPRNIFAAGDIYTQSNTTGFFLGSAADVALLRDDANTLAQRRSTNPQTFRVYNTSTDASNYERGFVRWATNVFYIGTEKAGTGTARALEFQTDGTTRLTIATTGLATFNNGIDLGIVGILRTRYINNGDNALTMWDFTAGGGGTAVFALGGTTPFMRFGGITSSFPAIQRNGNELRFRLADDTGFCPVRVSQIGFNGATASFPMLSNNGATLQTKLADDSAFAPHAMQYLDVTDGVTAPGAGTGRARIYVDTADGDLKVVFADGVVKTLATDT